MVTSIVIVSRNESSTPARVLFNLGSCIRFWLSADCRGPVGGLFAGLWQLLSSEMREPVSTAQQVLGHSSPNTTLTFTQLVEDSQWTAKLERILFPNVQEGPSLIH